MEALLLALLTSSRAAPAAYPGDRCRAQGAEHAHAFFAHAWALTCECTGGSLAPQSNGSYCPWWPPNAARPCGHAPMCNLSQPFVCKNLSNVVPMLTLAGSDPGSRECEEFRGAGNNACGWPGANAAVVAAAAAMPAGHRTFRLYGPTAQASTCRRTASACRRNSRRAGTARRAPPSPAAAAAKWGCPCR
jgi:hypothetical protein